MTARVTTTWAEERGVPEFLATGLPALSWQVDTDTERWQQAAARIELRRPGSADAQAELPGAQSQHVPWPFEPLASYSEAEVRVSVLDAEGSWSEPGDWVPLRTAALTATDWRAPFVALSAGSADDRATIRFRTRFELTAPVRRAVLSTTAHGVYEIAVNGVPASDEVLAPGWTAYDERLLFQSADVTGALIAGTNVLGASVAEGWYRERFGFDGTFAVAYPGPTALSAQLRLEYEDGSIEWITTGSEWEATDVGPVVSASIYQGERYDARLEDDALASAQVPLPGSTPAVVIEADPSRIAPAALPPVRRIERRAVADVVTSPSGSRIFDFGQNLVGWLELDLDLPVGTELTLRHAEVLEHGELGTRPLRFAAATDTVITGADPLTWSPRFTFHGFRYAEISGADLDAASVTAVVVHTDLLRTGWLQTSDPDLNRLHENVVWGMRGNFLSIPTDCPQRDERLGWTGDIQVFSPTASYLYDSSAFLRSWLRDLALQQTDSGVPMVVPSPLPGPPSAAAAWGDAATLVPDTLYDRFGDERILVEQYDSMRRWVETLRGLAGDDRLWTGTFQFGDWLDPSAPPHNPAAAKTDADIVATAYFFHSTARLAAAAEILGEQADAREYATLAEEIRIAFLNEYVSPAGRMVSDAHTAYAMAIVFGIVEGEQRRLAGERLAELARAYSYRVRTGFVGTPLICDALTATGHLDTAYRLLLERGNPSWLYPITMGATTIWERWDSMLPDGSINPGEMTSFNHYALGAVADWMQRTIGGIAPAAPGYRAVTVAPQPGGGLDAASAQLDTGYGRVGSRWRITGGRFELSVLIPAGVSATVTMPFSGESHEVGNGEHRFSEVAPDMETLPRAFSLDSTLAEFADDPTAKQRLQDFFASIGYFIALGWDSSGAWRSDARLRSSLIMFPTDKLPELEILLTTLNTPVVE